MCGLVSIFSSRSPIDRRRVQLGLEAVRHRGPDGSGLWVDSRNRVALGHRRLAVISPESGRQPILNETEDVALIVNGELYDHERWRDRLQSDGHRFRTRTDSELLLHLYEEEVGLDAVRKLRGEFAFVLWDDRTATLVAGRDPYGVKPLFYSSRDGELVLASEAKAFFAMGHERSWDRESLTAVTSMQYLPPDRSLFAGIRPVPPGSLLIARDGELRFEHYTPDVIPTSAGTAPREELRHRLSESVRLRLRSDVPFGCALSGGIDSSIVTGLATKHSRRSFPVFSLGFDSCAHDELEIARGTALANGVEFVPVPTSTETLLDALPEAVRAGEGLAINGHLPAKFLLMKAVREHGVTVLLTGEGADEVFYGYEHLHVDHLRQLGCDREIERLRSGNRNSVGSTIPDGSTLPLETVRKRLGSLPAFLEGKASLGAKLHALMTKDFRDHCIDRDPIGSVVANCAVPDRDPVQISRHLWNRTALSSYILSTLGDRMEMAHGIEGRVPFLDQQLSGFAESLPMRNHFDGPIEKQLLRDAVSDILPPHLRTRRKHPLDTPPLLARPDGVPRSVQNQLRSDPLPGLFSSRKIDQLLQDLPGFDDRQRSAWDPPLMLLWTMVLLQDAFDLRTP